MRFVQIEMLPSGKALFDVDKLTYAVPEGAGSRLLRHLGRRFHRGRVVHANVQPACW